MKISERKKLSKNKVLNWLRHKFWVLFSMDKYIGRIKKEKRVDMIIDSFTIGFRISLYPYLFEENNKKEEEFVEIVEEAIIKLDEKIRELLKNG